MRFFKIKHINFNLVTTPAKPWSYQFMLVPSRYGEVSLYVGTESCKAGEVSIKSGNEPERRVIIFILVTKALSLRHHIYSLRSASRLRLSAAKVAW